MKKHTLLAAAVLNHAVFSTIGCGLDAAGIGCGGPPFTSGDASTDAGNDAMTDAGNDVNTDTGTDSGIDSGPDAETDSGTDAMADSGTDAGSDTDSGDGGSGCNTTGTWGFEPGSGCYAAFQTNGTTCVAPPVSTPDGVCETTTCWQVPTAGQNVFIWTADANMVVDIPGGPGDAGIGMPVIYKVAPLQPTCTQSVALSQVSAGWNTANITGPIGGKYTLTAPGSAGQPVLYWISVE